MTSATDFEEPKPDGTKGILLAILAVVVLLIPIGIFFAMRKDTPPKKGTTVAVNEPGNTPAKTADGNGKDEPQKGDGKGTISTEPDSKKNPETTPPTVEPKNGDEVPVEMPTDQDETPIKALVTGDSGLKQTLAAFRQKYDFDGAAQWLQDQGYTEAPAGKLLRERYEDLSKFRLWLETQIGASTASDPLIILTPGQSGETRVWGDTDGGLVVQTQDTQKPTPLDSMQPLNILGMARAALVQNQPGDKKPPVVVRRWMGLFAREYDLPAPRVPKR